jgi:hypothetical protein
VDFSSPANAYMTLPATTFPTNTTAQTVSYRVGSYVSSYVSNGPLYEQAVYASGLSGVGIQNIAYFYEYNSATIVGPNWSPYGGGMTSSAGFTAGMRVTNKVGGSGSGVIEYIYTNGTQTASVTTPSSGSNPINQNLGSATTTADTIGCANISGTAGTFTPGYYGNMQLYYISSFASNLSTSDQTILESQ